MTDDDWIDLGRQAIVKLLDEQHAVTLIELEARLADRVYDHSIVGYPIQPHHLTTARKQLEDDGEVVPTIALSRGKEGDVQRPVTTYSRPTQYGTKTRIERTAARKRLLHARFLGWATRFAGHAGEAVTDLAMRQSPLLSQVSGSTRNILTRTYGEIDNSCWYVDTDSTPPTAVHVLVEVKNRREHLYPSNDELEVFLRKAALIQDDNPDTAILPLVIARRVHPTLWTLGEQEGFLPSFVRNQVLSQEAEITAESLAEVRDELGLDDLTVVAPSKTTNYHRGIFDQAVPSRAGDYAANWRTHYVNYLPMDRRSQARRRLQEISDDEWEDY